MRILKITVIAAFILLLTSFVGLIIFLKMIDADHFRTLIVKQASSSLGRDVGIQELSFDFSVRKGIILNIRGFSVANDEGIEPPYILQIKRMRLDINLLAFLKERRMVVSDINIIAPKLTVIRDASQKINIQDFVKAPPHVTAGPEAGKRSGTGEARSSEKARQADLLSILSIDKITMADGEMTFIDRAMNPECSTIVKKIDLSVVHFSFKDRFEYYLGIGLFSPRTSISSRGYAQLDLADERVRLEDVKLTIDFREMTEWKDLSGWVPQILMFSDVSGTADMAINELILDASTVSALRGRGQLRDGKFGIDQLSAALDQCRMDFDFTENIFDISKLSCVLLDGKIGADLKLKDYLTAGPFEGRLLIENLDLNNLATQLKLPIQVAGYLNSHASVSSKSIDPNVFSKAVLGQSDLNILNGRIVNINLLKLFLNGLSMIPDAAEKIEETLPDNYRGVLQQPDTIFNKAEVKADIADGRAVISSSDISANGFKLDLQGYYDLSDVLSVSGGIAVLSDLSASLVTAIPELEALFNEKKEIYIPMIPYQGPVAKVKIMPDVKYLAKTVIVSRGRQELENLIDKALGKDEDVPPDQGAGPQEESIEKEIIGNILDGIFGDK